MKQGKKSVFGIYQTRPELERGIDALKSASFRNDDISVLMPNRDDFNPNLAHTKESKAPEGASTGATTGAVIGGGLGWLIGIGALAIPGVGPFIAAGPIVAAIAGMGIGGAVGGVTGALVGLGIPEYEAKRYAGYVSDGGILLSVHVDDNEWAKKAKDILETTGAHDIAASGEVNAEAPKMDVVTPVKRSDDYGTTYPNI